ncbi:hypothetical protein CEXT_810921 [Caerostris extrusa]|uniref:Uncharacterized protein n=1 Tax=Caerostris extrusa TaxID=172846 RepID=A0AAV4MB31_CAEEX|nr:hypothetical protein CEXT_810921 [Caerostris extrusa]
MNLRVDGGLAARQDLKRIDGFKHCLKRVGRITRSSILLTVHRRCGGHRGAGERARPRGGPDPRLPEAEEDPVLDEPFSGNSRRLLGHNLRGCAPALRVRGQDGGLGAPASGQVLPPGASLSLLTTSPLSVLTISLLSLPSIPFLPFRYWIETLTHLWKRRRIPGEHRRRESLTEGRKAIG